MNKHIALALAAIGLAGAGIGAGYWFATQRMPHDTGVPAASAAAAEKAERTPL